MTFIPEIILNSKSPSKNIAFCKHWNFAEKHNQVINKQNNETFKIHYYAKKHSKFIERNAKWDEKCRYWLSKAMKPCITYFDLDKNEYRTAVGSYWIDRG